jgi:hypothetical protein
VLVFSLKGELVPLCFKQRNMVIVESSIQKCLFNPLSTDLKNEMLVKLPLIKEYKGGKNKIPINNLLKYVILMYDVQSPMHKETKEYYQRKRECAKAAGFPVGADGKWRDDVVGILIGEDEWFNDLVVRYLALLALPEYTQLVVYLELLARRTKKILDGEDDDKTHSIINALTEKIKELTNVIFGSGEIDEIQQARRALYEQAEEERVRMRPEDIINLMNETGGLPNSWGYTSDFTVDKLEFIGDKQPMTDID